LLRSATRCHAGNEIKNRKEPRQKDSDKPKPFPLFPATHAVDNEGESSKDKTKGKILDIDV
jgi:hypothetical protein